LHLPVGLALTDFASIDVHFIGIVGGDFDDRFATVTQIQ